MRAHVDVPAALALLQQVAADIAQRANARPTVDPTTGHEDTDDARGATCWSSRPRATREDRAVELLQAAGAHSIGSPGRFTMKGTSHHAKGPAA